MEGRAKRSPDQLKPTAQKPRSTLLPRWPLSHIGSQIRDITYPPDFFEAQIFHHLPDSSHQKKKNNTVVETKFPTKSNISLIEVEGSTGSHISNGTFSEKLQTSTIAHIVAALFCALLVYLLFRFCKKEKEEDKPGPLENDLETPPNCQYVDDRYDDAFEIPRKNLEKGNPIGNGYFGDIFEAMLLLPLNNRSSFLNVFPKRKMPVVMKTPGNARTPEEAKIRQTIFKREMKLMCNVGFHFNVVAMFGAVTRNTEGMFIVMEKCSKGNLQAFLRSQKKDFISQFERKWNPFQVDSIENIQPNMELTRSHIFLPVQYLEIEKNAEWKPDLSKKISTAHLLSFAIQIAQGMDYLHSIKCIHRDLAARNILLTPEGICKIADFGLAKRIVYKDYYRTQTVQELPYKWMSIESLNEGIFTAHSDIWSYGIVLFEIFTLGEFPYPLISMHDFKNEVNNGIRNDQPNFCPDEIYHQMKLCWSVDKDQRPSFTSSAEMMRRHLSSASKEVLQNLDEEKKRETGRQKLFEALRPVSKNRSSSDTAPLSPVDLEELQITPV